MGRLSALELLLVLTVVAVFFAAEKRAVAAREMPKTSARSGTFLPAVDLAVVIAFAGFLSVLVLLFLSLT